MKREEGAHAMAAGFMGGGEKNRDGALCYRDHQGVGQGIARQGVYSSARGCSAGLARPWTVLLGRHTATTRMGVRKGGRPGVARIRRGQMRHGEVAAVLLVRAC